MAAAQPAQQEPPPAVIEPHRPRGKPPAGYSELHLNYPTSDYVYWKNIDGRLALYKRKLDGEIYVGHLSTLHDNQYDRRIWNLYEKGAGEPAANVLNHENLVSVHTEVVQQQWQPGDAQAQEEADPEHLILYDYCDAGSLHSLFQKPPVKVSIRGPFMPESLCWHVAISLLRALQWLHEGIRDQYDVIENASTRQEWTNVTRCHRVRTKTEPEKGWLPILHRDIKPSNVLLSHPKGIETYGTVKLGGLQRCIVTGGMLHEQGVNAEDAPAIGWEKSTDPTRDTDMQPEIWKLREWYGNWKKLGRRQPMHQRPYTMGNDIWAVGAILYQMMFGMPPPAAEECRGGGCHAWHWYRRSLENKAVPHRQSNPLCMGDHDLDSFPDHLNYSGELKSLLKMLMGMNRKPRPLASEILDGAWRGYTLWADNSEAGKLYRDVYDDMWFRRNNELRMVRKQARQLGAAPDVVEPVTVENQDVDMLVL
ncbi:kinase-like domain-containing protein [Cladorrhinum sp. PSN259]|nr:kinase-like domain-containing protein [Cladorrhinum sp. PSN259]